MRIRPQKTPVSKSLKYMFFRSQVFIKINIFICKCHLSLMSLRSSKTMHWVTLGPQVKFGIVYFSFGLFALLFLICLACISTRCFRLLVVNYCLLLVCELLSSEAFPSKELDGLLETWIAWVTSNYPQSPAWVYHSIVQQPHLWAELLLGRGLRVLFTSSLIYSFF